MRDDRTPLPTKGQINAITDIAALEDMRDEIERVSTKIETDLQFLVEDEDWAARARMALAIHRFTERLVARRIGALRRNMAADVKAKAKRPAEDCDQLTPEVLGKRPVIHVRALTSTQEVDAQTTWLVARIDAVTLDREDEIGMGAGERDEAFLAATNSALRHMRDLRQQLQTRRGELSRAEKATAKALEAPAQETRERLFIDAAREVLDRSTYLAIWDRVDRMQQTRDAA